MSRHHAQTAIITAHDCLSVICQDAMDWITLIHDRFSTAIIHKVISDTYKVDIYILLDQTLRRDYDPQHIGRNVINSRCTYIILTSGKHQHSSTIPVCPNILHRLRGLVPEGAYSTTERSEPLMTVTVKPTLFVAFPGPFSFRGIDSGATPE
jgi:hypothetical protein